VAFQSVTKYSVDGIGKLAVNRPTGDILFSRIFVNFYFVF